MRRVAATLLIVLGAAAPGFAQTSPVPAQTAPVIADIRIHGNQIVTDSDVLKIAGVIVGTPFDDKILADVDARLRASKKFETVQVLKRFASIDDASKIELVIIVNEGPVNIDVPDDPTQPARVTRKTFLTKFLFAPMLDSEDGYGVRYGARLAFADVAGSRSRLAFPLSWGGDRHAGAEFQKDLTGPVFTHIEFGSAFDRRVNPFYQVGDNRRELWARAERVVGPIRFAGDGGWQHVSFAAASDDIRTAGADATLDTRFITPAVPVWAIARVERLAFDQSTVVRMHIEAKGEVPLIRQATLVLRAAKDDANAPLPPYLKSLLGGMDNLRGYRAGYAVGDTMVTTSVTLHIPLTSPLRFGQVGINLFEDAGKAYDKGTLFGDRPWLTGLGGSVWFTAAVLHLELSVAHGRGAGTRVNFACGVDMN